MSKLILLDERFEDYRIVDEYVSLIWTTRFKEPGDFELQVPASKQNIEDYIPDRYLFSTDFYVKNETEEYAHLMIIETVELSENILKITGRSLKSILDRRIIWGKDTIKAYSEYYGSTFESGIDYFEKISGQYKKTTDTYPVSGKQYYTHTKVEDAITQVINFNIIVPIGGTYPENYPGDYRRIPNFVLGDFTGYHWGVIEEEIQYDGTSILNVINDICSKSTITDTVGYTVVYNFKTSKIEFRLYKPKDRSLDQYEKDPIIFSEQFNELKSSKYIESTANYKNVAYVSGERYSDDEIDKFHQVAVVGTQNSSALTRRELFIDASSMQHELDDGTIYSTATYQDMLVQRGSTELNKKENRYSKVFEGEVDFNQIGYILGIDYDIGDIVEITNRYNVNKRLRVVEVVLSLSTSGNTIVPGFEDVDVPEATLEYGAVQGGTEHIAYLTEEMLGTIIGDQTSSANQAINQIIDLKDLAYASDLRRTDQALTSEIQARSNGDTVLESAIKQTAHTISMTVSQPGGENTSAGITISLLDEDGNLLNNATGTINLNGIVTFTNNNYADKTELPDIVAEEIADDLSAYTKKSELSSGTTVVNGGCITTGNILCAGSTYWTKIETATGNLSWNMLGSSMTTEGVLTLHSLASSSPDGGIQYRAGIVVDSANDDCYALMSNRNVYIKDPSEDKVASLDYNTLLIYEDDADVSVQLSPGELWCIDYYYMLHYTDGQLDVCRTNSSGTTLERCRIRYDGISYYNGSSTYYYATQKWVQDQGYLTSHQSLSGYATQTWVRNQGYLTSHQSLADYLKKSGGTMTGNLTLSLCDLEVKRTGSSASHVFSTNSSGKVDLQVAVSGNKGVYDTTNSNWMIYTNGSTKKTYIPNIYQQKASTVGTATNSSNWYVLADSSGALYRYVSSSKRYKNHITYVEENETMLSETINAARNLKPAIYRYNEGYVTDETYNDGTYNFGFIVEDLDEEIGSYVVGYVEKDGAYIPENWDVHPLVSIITTLAQDNANRLDEKDKEIAELKDRIETLEKLVNQLLPEEVRK